MATHEEVVDEIVEYLQSEIPETDKHEITKILASHYPSAATKCPECQGEKVGYICVCDDCHAQWDQSTCPPSAVVKELVKRLNLICECVVCEIQEQDQTDTTNQMIMTATLMGRKIYNKSHYDFVMYWIDILMDKNPSKDSDDGRNLEILYDAVHLYETAALKPLEEVKP